MKITCPGCQWNAEIPEEKIPVGGVTATCRKCQTRFPISREALPTPHPTPLPDAAPAPASNPVPAPASTPATTSEFSCPKCGTPQAKSDACINCNIIFAKFAEKQRVIEAAHPAADEMPGLPEKGRFKGIAYAVIGLLTVALLIYRVEIVSAAKLLLNIQPTHARHIPASALVVTRSNIASIFLKTGLRGATDDPVYKQLLEFGGRLYPRFPELLANPVKESGIDLAEDVYAFTEAHDGRSSRVGVLFGISDRDRFAGFLQRLKTADPVTEAGVSIVTLKSGSSVYWNSSFGLIYPGGVDGRNKQRALAIMAMKKDESIVSDPLKKKWLEGKDDCLVSVDLEKIVNLPHLSFLTKSSPFNTEVYRGSSLGFALNFVNGRATFDSRVTGAALLAEIRSINAPPSKEFLESLPADTFLLFMASHIPFAQILEKSRQANPEQYRRTDETVEKLTMASLEQLAASFTGDLGMVLNGLPRRSGDSQQSGFFGGDSRVEGSIVFGVRPDSVAVRLLHSRLQEGPEARNVRRDGRIYRVDSGNGYYLLADNGYIALSTSSDVVTGLAERKKTDKPVMPAGLLERCSSSTFLLELKLTPLLTALSERQPSDISLEQLKISLTELHVSSRLDKDQVSSRGELLFRDEKKNSLYQIAKLAVTISEMKRALQPGRP
jgi:hypothetical protein